jgi:hypothetical protein
MLYSLRSLWSFLYRFNLISALSTDLLLIIGARLPGTENKYCLLPDLLINEGMRGTGLVGYITHGMPGPSWTFEGARGHPVVLVGAEANS